MIRRTVLVVACLVLGAILDITVAWVHFLIDPSLFEVRQYGWPLATMQSEGEGSFWIELLVDRTNEKRYSAIRLTVGTVINTFFYAAICWFLFTAPSVLRRRLRRRRGQCEKCAYPIGVSPVCTECGAAVPVEHGNDHPAV